MNLNATLFGQMITFAIFVWFTMRYVWPPIMQAIAERQQKIADGLAAADKAQLDLELAQQRIAEQVREAKVQAADIVEQANHRAAQIVEEAKQTARKEGERLLTLAQAEIAQEAIQARQQLRQEVVTIAMAGAEKLIGRHLDEAANQDLIEQLIKEI